MGIFKKYKNAEKGRFVLKDILYSVTGARLSARYQNIELVLYLEVCAETKDSNVEYEMSSLRLYHNNGFRTHAHGFNDVICCEL